MIGYLRPDGIGELALLISASFAILLARRASALRARISEEAFKRASRSKAVRALFNAS